MSDKPSALEPSLVMPEFTIRPVDEDSDTDSLEAVFKVHLNLRQLDLRAGDLCTFKSASGKLIYGFAYPQKNPNANNAKPIAKVTEIFKDFYELSFKDKVTLEKGPDTRLHADIVHLTSTDSHERGSLLQDFRDIDQVSYSIKHQLYAISGASSSFSMSVSSRLKSRKRYFKIQSVEPSATASTLYKVDDKTKVILNDAIGTDATSDVLSRPKSPEVTHKPDFAKIGGLEQQLKVIAESISRIFQRQSNASVRYPVGYRREVGILLHGPEGTGKSLVIQGLSAAFSPSVFHVSSETLGPTAKDAQTRLREIFTKAERAQPSLIVIDQFETVFGDAESARRDLLDCLTSQLRNLKGEKTLVVAAVRSLQAVDKSLRSYDTFKKVVEIPIPDAKARSSILKSFLETRNQDELCTRIGERTHGYVGRDLVELCIVAIEKAEERIEEHLLEGEKVSSDERPQPNGITEMEKSAMDTVIADLLTDLDFSFALVEVRPSAMKEVFLETPKVRWEDIGGAEQVKEAMYKVTVRPYKHPNVVRRMNLQPQKGILLYGPPGCSKTLTAQAVATEAGLNFLAVKGAELLNMYVGESERAIRDLFQKARAASPSVIFFDEIDSIAASTRGGGSHTSGLNVVTTLLNEMDGIETLGNVLVIAATNAPEVLDPALMRPGRIDTILYVGPPKLQARKEIFQIRNKKRPIAADVDLDDLANRSEGYSGAEIARICEFAVDEAVSEWERGNMEEMPDVSMRHFEKALEGVPKQISPEMRKRYEDWRPGGVSKLL